MVTVPMVVVLGFIAWLMVRKGGWKAGPVVLGCILGLFMAATPLGPEVIRGLNVVVDAAVGGITSEVGGAR
jgi:hypothetical protein